MHSLMNTETATVDDAWERLAALRELRAAVSALEEACGSLPGIVADSDWRSDGVQVLHDILEEMQHLASGHLFTVRETVWELEGVNGR